jgi:hypothetical protein
MRKVIYKDDRYPVFYLEEPYEGMPSHIHVVEVPDALLVKHREANAMYEEVQDELEALYNAL